MLKSMRKCLALMLIFVVMAVSLAGCGSSKKTSSAAEGGTEKITLIAGHSSSPDSLVEFAFKKMNDIVKEKTNGQITIEIHGNEALGTEDQMLEQCQMGTLDLVTASAAPVTGYVKEYMACDLPFMFSSNDDAWKFYDGKIGDELFAKSDPTGMVGLCWWENGFRNFTNNKKVITSPADMKGLKIRTMQSNVHMASVNALGASATPIAFGELYSSLQQGVVDGEENPLLQIQQQKFDEVQKYCTISRHFYDPSPIFISQKTLDKLTPEQAKIIKDASIEARDAMRKQSIEQEKTVVADLQSKGVEITELTPDQVKAFQDATKDVYKKFEKEIGSDFLKEFFAAAGR